MISDYFVKGILEHPKLTKLDGGIDCQQEMDFWFKFIVNTVLSIVNIAIVTLLYKKVLPKKYPLKIRSKPIKFFELCLAAVCIFVLLVQMYFKISTLAVMCIFNPCHFCLV